MARGTEIVVLSAPRHPPIDGSWGRGEEQRHSDRVERQKERGGESQNNGERGGRGEELVLISRPTLNCKT